MAASDLRWELCPSASMLQASSSGGGTHVGCREFLGCGVHPQIWNPAHKPLTQHIFSFFYFWFKVISGLLSTTLLSYCCYTCHALCCSAVYNANSYRFTSQSGKSAPQAKFMNCQSLGQWTWQQTWMKAPTDIRYSTGDCAAGLWEACRLVA